MLLQNACIPAAISTAFGSLAGNSMSPVGVLRLVVVGATCLKCPNGKGNDKVGWYIYATRPVFPLLYC